MKFFDKNLPIKISCDASKLGLRAVLEQLSIEFSSEKLHEYVYGFRFVATNHMPLISIFQKTLNKSPQRIQRFLLPLQRYNSQLNYVPENQLFVVDILRRLLLPDSTSEIKIEEMNYIVHSV